MTMKKSKFLIQKMDCPSEEQIIRMKLLDLTTIQSLEFDIPSRTLTVCHTGDHAVILERLDSLDFDTRFEGSVQADGFDTEEGSGLQRRLLWQVLAINLFFFVLEVLTGLLAHSMGLVADSLDMLADALVYGLALYAVGGTLARKNSVARTSGYFQMTLAVAGFVEVIRRFISAGPVPSFQTMILISALALAGNVLCLLLLQKSRSRESHMQASMIFTSNDVIVNAGVIGAGVLVWLTGSKIPDLVIGLMVFGIVIRGAVRILKLARAGK